MTKKILWLAPLFMMACHPLAMFRAKALAPASSSTLSRLEKLSGASDGAGVSANANTNAITVAIDDHGIPFINASTPALALYGLGFVHARDRIFQLDVTRRAARGTLSQIFGRRTLSYDQRMRIISYRLDEQVQNLSKQEHALLDAYVKGVNDGASKRGRSAEHFLLGVEFEAITKADVMAIARLQSWQLAADLKDELAKLEVVRSDLPQALVEELLAPVDDRSGAIIGGNYSETPAQKYIAPHYLAKPSANTHATKSAHEIVQSSGGASNAWVVNKRLSNTNTAMLFNDPHLRHTLPSNFYLATIKAGNMFATGASFVGVPAVLIGASKKVSWGVTASYTNAQDLVYLKLDEQNKNHYWVDGKKHELVPWPQKFCIKKESACVEKDFYISMFGPVIDSDYHQLIGKDERYSVMWTGFLVEEHRDLASRFVDLAKSQSMSESIAAIRSMTFPGINVVLAHVSGDIAYAFAGVLPKRHEGQNPYLPLDGSKSISLWQGVVPLDDKPLSINPSKGYIVTANQNIFSRGSKDDLAFGKQGSQPYRALRINNRIEEILTKNGELDAESLASIQLDATSIEAQELSKKLGVICMERFKNKNKSQQEYAKLLYDFDGEFSTKSKAALPYLSTVSAIIDERYANSLGENLRTRHFDYVIKSALGKELNGERTQVFRNVCTSPQDFRKYLGGICDSAYKNLTHRASSKPWRWRWGRHHYLKRHGLLSSAPILGALFRDKKREVAGYASAPMAENGTPVVSGANLRLIAKMSDPPQINMILDTGNKGTVGHKNSLDQIELWHQGKTLAMPNDWDKALSDAVSVFEINPVYFDNNK